MRSLTLAPGEAVFRRGDPSTAVYIVERGEIAILSGDGETEFEVARLSDGDLFGESGVLESRARSASAVAILPTTLLETEADAFLKAFGIDNDRALSLLKLLCHRLRATTRRATQAEGELHAVDPALADATEVGSRSRLRLIPDSERLHRLLGRDAVEIRRLPFQVGNRFGGETSPIASPTTYCIPARAEVDLSSPHFEIRRRGGRLVVRDLSQRVGTLLNGQLLSRYSSEAVAEIRPGDNLVIAGDANSPFRFRLVFDPKRPPA
jgi:CRP-like cAMP-binding protein